MIQHLSKALTAWWTLAMGGFLGLAGGLVLAVILAFRSARTMQARPGAEPYRDPRFADHHADAVAGHLGQQLFAVGGVAALVLLGLAVLALVLRGLLLRDRPTVGSRRAGWYRVVALSGAVCWMGAGATVTLQINERWPGLYDTSAGHDELKTRRAAFDQLHSRSERFVTIAWLCGALALGLSPWCPQPAPRHGVDPS
jgi:hypothetical protein